MTQEERKTAIRRSVADAAHAVLDHIDNIEEAVIMTHGTDGKITCLAGSEVGTTGLAMIAIHGTRCRTDRSDPRTARTFHRAEHHEPHPERSNQ